MKSIRAGVERIWLDIVGTTEGSWEDAGGDSLRLIQCVSALEKLTGRELDMEAFTYEMNLADMVHALTTHQRHQEILNQLPALVLLPGTMGYGPGLAAFGAKLANTAHVIPVRYPDLDAVLAGHGSIEDMTASVLKQIKAEQPHGDIRLIGYSFGGGVAFEVARRLIAEGRVVKFLGILDTNAAPRIYNQRATLLRTLQRIRSHQVSTYRMACRALAKAVVRVGREKQFCRLLQGKSFAGTRFILRVEIEELLRMQAFSHWVAHPRPPLPVTGTVFVSQRPGLLPDLGWRPLFAQLGIIKISGGHLDLVSEPHLSVNLPLIEQAFAASIDILEKVELLG